MIRIETTAEFDAEGRFTVSGQVTEPVTPGPHRVVVELEESEAGPAPGLRKEGNVWVLDCVLAEDVEEVRRRLDEESLRRIMEGPFE